MKKFFIFLFSVIFILIAAAAVFFFTFDANRYKDTISRQMEKYLGHSAAIGSLGLKWQDGIALELSKLAVYEDAARKSAGIQLESATVSLKLLPLLHKNIQITSIVLEKPSLDIVRGKDGAVKIGGIDLSQKAPESRPPAVSSPSSPASAAALTIDSVAIRGGYVLFHDLSGPVPSTIEIKNLGVTVKNFSLTRAFQYAVSAAVFSDKQNIKISGNAALAQGTRPASLENLVLTTDLADWDRQKLSAAFPGFASAGIKELDGIVSVQMDRLDLDPQSIDSAKGQVALKNGKVSLVSLNLPVDHMDLTAVAGGNQIEITHLTANVAGGTIDFTGNATALKTRPVLAVKGAIKDLPVGDLVRSVNPGAPQLSGHATVNLEGQAQGLVWESISHSLSGRARIQMADGVLLNYNILKEVIDKISVIPDAESAIQSHFPQAYQLRLQDKSTLLKPIDLNATIVNGVFNFNPLNIATDFVQINGSGKVGLDRRVDINANLLINQEISQVLTGAFTPAQLLCDNTGRMVLPVAIQGDIPQVKIVPDRQYITSRLLSSQAQQMVQQIIKDPQKGVGSIEDILKKNIKGLKI